MSGLLLAEKIRATTGLQGRERGVAGAVKLILLQLWNFGCSFGVVVSGLEYVTGFISLVDFFPFSPPPCPAPDMFLQKKSQGFGVRWEERFAWYSCLILIQILHL